MAIVKAVSSRASIGKAVSYVTKDEKTEEKLISGIECSPETAIDEMKATKEIWNKTEGRQYKHYVHSFPPDEKITPEEAHEMAKELCKDRFKGHEVIIATHKDKEHIHSHIIVNSVNYENGSKLQQSKKDLELMKEHSNELSRERGLSVPKKGDEITAYTKEKYKALEKGITGENNYKSYVLDCYKAVSETKGNAINKEDFVAKMKDKGFETNWKENRKHITFTDQEGNKVRNTNLEKTFKESFGKEELKHGFERNFEKSRAIDRAREQLGSVKNREIGERSGTDDTRAIISEFRETGRDTAIAVRIDESKRSDRIAKEQSVQRERNRSGEQKTQRGNSKGFDRER